MRIATLYDIHGNLPALEAVLDEISQENVDRIIIGGDVIAGPMPGETLTLLESITTPIQFIHGNAESEVLRHLAGQEPGGLSPRANEEAYWVAEKLTNVHKAFIASWSKTITMTVEGLGEVLFCHASPHNDIDVFTRLTPEEKLLPLFSHLTASVVICGHTHMQFERMIGGTRVINSGSVGMPFGKTGAFWLLLDTNITFKRTEYNRTLVAERIRQTDYPGAEDFATGNVLEVPSEENALEMLTYLETKQNVVSHF